MRWWFFILMAAIFGCGLKQTESRLVKLDQTLTSAEKISHDIDSVRIAETISMCADTLSKLRVLLSDQELDLRTAQQLDSILFCRDQLTSIRKALPEVKTQLKAARENYVTLSSLIRDSQNDVSGLNQLLNKEQKNAVQLEKLLIKIRSESAVAVNYLTTVF